MIMKYRDLLMCFIMWAAASLFIQHWYSQDYNQLSQQMSGMQQSIEMQISEMPITQWLTIEQIADKCNCYICENGNWYCKILNEYYK